MRPPRNIHTLEESIKQRPDSPSEAEAKAHASLLVSSPVNFVNLDIEINCLGPLYGAGHSRTNQMC